MRDLTHVIPELICVKSTIKQYPEIESKTYCGDDFELRVIGAICNELDHPQITQIFLKESV
jgi:hypothetical protein